LTGGSRAALPRQQTLGATLDWSYLLLTKTQRRIFQRLSVFASGWTLHAAEAICAGDSVVREDVVEAVVQLVRKSLVVRLDVRSGRARYGLLETVRQYAWERLLGRGLELSRTRERHAAYYSALVERLDPAAAHTTSLGFSGEAPTAPVFEILEDAQDNVRVALHWWLQERRAVEALVLVRAFGPHWQWVGMPVEGRRWVEAALELAAPPESGVPAALRAQALMFGGALATLQGDHDKGRGFGEASVAIWRSVGDQVGLALALTTLGINLLFRSDHEGADSVLDEAVALAQAVGNPFALSATLTNLGVLRSAQAQHERAWPLYSDALAAARTVERTSDRGFSVTRALVHLARAESELGAHDRAMSLFKEGFAVMREYGLAGVVLASALDWIAAEFSRTADPVRAAGLFGAADAQWRRAGSPRFRYYVLSHERDVRATEAKLDPETFAHARSAGTTMKASAIFASILDETSPPNIEAKGCRGKRSTR
jgi:tetratricopeptide (TPR) repeat protein